MTTASPPAPFVSRSRATSLTFRVLIRQLVNRARLIFLALLGASFVLVGWAVGAAELDPDPEFPGVDPYVLAAVRSVSTPVIQSRMSSGTVR